MHNKLAVELAGLRLANPTMLAAGILGMTSLSLKRVTEAGAGAVVTKSIGLKSRTGYTNPTVVQTDCGVLNAMGLPNPSIEYFAGEITEAKTIGCPVIVSVYGFSAEEFVQVAKKAENAGADGLELNVSCPHVEKTGSEIGQDTMLLEEVVRAVKRETRIPVFVKLTPNVTDIVECAKAAEKSGADAVVAINTVRAMAINVEAMKPILGNKFGGLSGPAIKPIALRCVYEIYRQVNVPIIGCGGVSDWRGAVEFMLAGAKAVQIGTAVAFKGLDVFQSVTKGIDAYLETKGFESVKEIVGLAHKR
ncbi:MAG TPA: dihydroorotate dehydrogenase [Candidatus Krumholzibacteriaceae bacterium]|nr:dihydroorotate dehydrogenase [Candidatus Krumholzibacteriaceae bacterium]